MQNTESVVDIQGRDYIRMERGDMVEEIQYTELVQAVHYTKGDTLPMTARTEDNTVRTKTMGTNNYTQSVLPIQNCNNQAQSSMLLLLSDST